VRVVLIHWDQPDRCADTVAAFRAQAVAVDLLVVDNGSTPASLERLRAVLADDPVEIVALGRNAGFGPAANVGFRRWLEWETGEWVAIAPHDALPAPDCLGRMLDALEPRPEVGLASADVGDGQTPVVDAYFGSITRPARVEVGFEPADYPHGTLLLARRACLDDVGVFDERYFAYCEEADLGLRAQAAGWEVGLVRGARVHNPQMGPGPGPDVVDYLMHRNTLLLVREHFGRYHAFIRFCVALLALARGPRPDERSTLLYAPRGRMLGLVDFLRGRFGAPPRRLFAAYRTSVPAPDRVPVPDPSRGDPRG
jgi:GT2 family glycosyltransferase